MPSDVSVVRLGSAASYFEEEGLAGDGFFGGFNKLLLWDIPSPPTLPSGAALSVSGSAVLAQVATERRKFLESLKASVEAPPVLETPKPTRYASVQKLRDFSTAIDLVRQCGCPLLFANADTGVRRKGESAARRVTQSTPQRHQRAKQRRILRRLHCLWYQSQYATEATVRP